MPLDKTGYYPESESSEPEDLRGHETSAQAEPVEEHRPCDHMEQNHRPEQKHEHESKDARPLGESIADGVSTFLSWVLVPLLMPVYGVMLLFGTSVLVFNAWGMKVAMTLVAALINVAIPALLVLLLKRLGIVSDVGLNGRKERMIPYVIAILCLGGTGWYFSVKGAPMWATMFFIGGAAAGLVNFLINFRWKISAHAAGIAGIVAMLARVLQTGYAMPSCMPWFMASIVFAGLLGSARIWLGRHTLMQVLCGYVTGFCGVYFMTMIQ